MFLRRWILLAAIIATYSGVPALAENTAFLKNGHHEQNACQKVAPGRVFAKLFETLATRPGVTEPYIVEALRPVAMKAGRAMMDELQEYCTFKELRGFAHALQAVMKNFVSDYADSEAGKDGRFVRVRLIYDLHQEFLVAAENAGIPLERLDLAFLRGCARFEKGLERSSVENVLSAADRELIDLLLLEALHQFSARIYVQQFSGALKVINPLPVPSWPERWQQVEEVLENTLEIMVSELEAEVLGDPAVLADANKLLLYQLNELAKSDLLGHRIGMEVYFAAIDEDDLQNLADRMAAVGGVMAGMTVETLLQSGLFGTFDNPYGGGPIIHLDEIAVYDWVEADMRPSYRPMQNLPEQLALLGGERLESPDFNLFGAPYLPIFQLEYDLDLCDEILKAKKKTLYYQLVEEIRPISMQERYALKRADAMRRDKIFKRLTGVTEEEKEALRIILTPIASCSLGIH